MSGGQQIVRSSHTEFNERLSGALRHVNNFIKSVLFKLWQSRSLREDDDLRK